MVDFLLFLTPLIAYAKNNIQLASLNVHGLANKLVYDDLEEFISKYDIVCLCETFCISEDYENPLHDQNSIHNYTLIHKPRDKCSRASGGLCCAISNDFIQFVKHVPNECCFLLWLKIDKSVFHTDEDIFLANVYVPPEGSLYVTATCFDEIENEVTEFMKLSKYVIIAGDLNAHTKHTPRYYFP